MQSLKANIFRSQLSLHSSGVEAGSLEEDLLNLL